jgi:dTDP-4-dehydrorhamnose reductase
MGVGLNVQETVSTANTTANSTANKLRVLVTGAGGLVGRAVVEHCRALGDEVLSYEHKTLDIADRKLVRETVLAHQPSVVINCAAWTNVDGCESDLDRAFSVNAFGPQNLALGCKEVGCGFITISTDYVFDGNKSGFYTQLDRTNPESVYAASKLEGERLSALSYERSMVVRTGYVFGRGGTNFLSTVVDRARKGESLKAISDAYGTPTYANDLAERLRELAVTGVPGIYHVVNSGPGVSFEEFTRRVVALLGKGDASVEPVLSSTLNRPAKRPQNSRLRCLLTPTIGLPPLRDWERSLEAFTRDVLLK